MTEDASFDAMKKKADKDILMARLFFEGGSDIFINKGTKDRWKEPMTPEQLAQYDKRIRALLTPSALIGWSLVGR